MGNFNREYDFRRKRMDGVSRNKGCKKGNPNLPLMIQVLICEPQVQKDVKYVNANHGFTWDFNAALNE